MKREIDQPPSARLDTNNREIAAKNRGNCRKESGTQHEGERCVDSRSRHKVRTNFKKNLILTKFQAESVLSNVLKNGGNLSLTCL